MRNKNTTEIGLKVFVWAAVLTAALLAFPAGAGARSAPRRVDGVPVKPGSANPWLYAVMIDNVPGARPQYGLGAASVVYETLAEGGIPRFLAIYARRSVRRIGPVRSVRPYFADFAAEYRAALAHAGGSPDGLREIDRVRIHSINALNGRAARAFFRPGGYLSTHNLFTTGALIERELKRVGLARRQPGLRRWRFASDPPLARRPKQGNRLTVDFRSGSAYIVQYTYNRKKNAFERSTGGRPHRDGPRGSVLVPKNVLVLFVPKERLLDRQGRLGINVIGRGRGILLKNGRAITITWRKTTASHRTELSTEDGDAVTLTRGATWVEVVPRGKLVRVR